MIENRNIICIASNWFYDPTSKHHIMRILSERNHVIWVNYHASRRPSANMADAGAIIGKLRQVVQGPIRVSDHMTVITPMVVPLPGNSAAMAINRRLLTRQIRSVLRDLPDRPVQLWSFSPDVDYLCGTFDEECVIYYCVDEFSAFTGYDREAVLASEKRLCDRADLVVTTSQSLLHVKEPHCRHAALVTHGVDFDHFAGGSIAPIPADMTQIRNPVLGFWGLIQDWFDVQLVADVAKARPEWSLVLIGDIATDVSRLRSLGNMHLLGRRPYGELPAYARAFDVGLIPFRVNDLTRAVNPIKLREYLSAGLPVVSTPMPEVERYRGLVEIANGAEEFIGACERALALRGAEEAAKRMTAMRTETWRSKVEDLSRLVTSIANEPQCDWTSSRVCPAPSGMG
ncbi:MAG: glycosyltransferase [Planctomycetes bacterium]|nr:glycosyltransferase [Planctomycetota bacterium]